MIKLENVKKNFGDLSVLRGISIEIQDRQIYGIIGQSGAGKSTLLRCINGLESYDSGTITVNEAPVSFENKNELRKLQKKMGMIFQNFNLLNRLDVYDNVALPMKFWGMKTKTPEAEKKIRGLIELVGLGDKIHARPRELSGGQKQRVAIARALATDPEVLLCDEATSALDNQTQKQISDALDRLQCTRIVIAHRLSTLRNCNRILVLDEGRIAEDGTYDELIAKNGIFKELTARQMTDI